MRKRILGQAGADPPSDAGWLDLDAVAEVEVTSEDPSHPIELALRPGAGTGWRAGEAGSQTIRLRFDPPLRLWRVRLAFEEREAARTQEFVLRWSSARDGAYREVVRQQYNFSPPATTLEVEDYSVELDGVGSLELEIVPDVGGGESRASLREWRLA